MHWVQFPVLKEKAKALQVELTWWIYIAFFPYMWITFQRFANLLKTIFMLKSSGNWNNKIIKYIVLFWGFMTFLSCQFYLPFFDTWRLNVSSLGFLLLFCFHVIIYSYMSALEEIAVLLVWQFPLLFSVLNWFHYSD